VCSRRESLELLASTCVGRFPGGLRRHGDFRSRFPSFAATSTSAALTAACSWVGVSSLGWGAMAGNLAAGVLNNRFGRRNVLLLAAALFSPRRWQQHVDELYALLPRVSAEGSRSEQRS